MFSETLLRHVSSQWYSMVLGMCAEHYRKEQKFSPSLLEIIEVMVGQALSWYEFELIFLTFEFCCCTVKSRPRAFVCLSSKVCKENSCWQNLDTSRLGKIRWNFGLLAKDMRIWALGPTNRSKCGSVLTDHFAVMSFLCLIAFTHYSDSNISITATKCAPGVLREHYKAGKIKKIADLCTVSACYLTVARQSVALESLLWFFGWESRAVLGASGKKTQTNRTILLAQPATD